MSNYISEHRQALRERHYIRKAGTEEYWFDFSANVLRDYIARFGNDFCMVLYGSEKHDDAYVLPFRAVRTLFTTARMHPRRARWVGTIKNNRIQLSPSAASLSVSPYYNAFNLLVVSNDTATPLPHDTVSERSDDELNVVDLLRKVQAFNDAYRDAAPARRLVVSDVIARPGLISDYLKELRNHQCQLCNLPGFRQKNGATYSETHHIVGLHTLIQGSLCSDNIIVVCPRCHRMLHYAEVDLEHGERPNTVLARINGDTFTFERNLLTTLRHEA